MNRREALQQAALLMGGAISVPTLLGVLESCARSAAADWQPAVLNREALALVTRVVDIMLPRTDTPGALEVGVPAFIDTLLQQAYAPQARAHYLEGLREFEAAARETYRQPFMALGAEQQHSHVLRLQEAALAQARAASDQRQAELLRELRDPGMLAQRTQLPPAPGQAPFILTTRELALLGFFTSQPGATQVLQYLAIPGAYHGCLPVSEAGAGRRWATEPAGAKRG